MKGATAEPWVKTMSVPNRTKIKMIGSKINFLRSFMKAQSSRRISPILVPLHQFIVRIVVSYVKAAGDHASFDKSRHDDRLSAEEGRLRTNASPLQRG